MYLRANEAQLKEAPVGTQVEVRLVAMVTGLRESSTGANEMELEIHESAIVDMDNEFGNLSRDAD